MLSRCKKKDKRKVRLFNLLNLFRYQPSIFFIDLILNNYFHIDLQQIETLERLYMALE